MQKKRSKKAAMISTESVLISLAFVVALLVLVGLFNAGANVISITTKLNKITKEQALKQQSANYNFDYADVQK